MATQLGLYNQAFRLCGERQIGSLTDDRPARKMLDAIWATEAHNSWLEEGEWAFAARTVKIGYDNSYTPPSGFPQYGFEKPTDFVHAIGLYTDGYFTNPLTSYVDEADYWFDDTQDEIVVQYISNGASYGANMGSWPKSFEKYVAAFLALELAPEIKNDVNVQALTKIFKDREKEAKGKNSLKKPAQKLPQGSWAAARLINSRRE